jgi:hypothetical protein
LAIVFNVYYFLDDLRLLDAFNRLTSAKESAEGSVLSFGKFLIKALNSLAVLLKGATGFTEFFFDRAYNG